MNKRAYDGMAHVEAESGIHYSIDYRNSESDNDILCNAKRFYGVEMKRVIDRDATFEAEIRLP